MELMNHIKKLLFLVLFLGITVFGNSQTVWMFGPIVHFNFGNHKVKFSYGFEGSYWDYSHFPYGVDGGIEYESKKIRIYSEFETGFGLAGIATGPVLEFNHEEKKLHLGMQGSVWTNYFLGFQYRKRWIDNTTYHCAGVYVKLPVMYDGKSIFDDSNNNSSSSSSHHHWDWD